MRVETPAARRSLVDDLGDRVVVTVPVRAAWFARLFLPFWLVGWGAGEAGAARVFLEGRGSSFLALWLVLWTVGGLMALSALVWAWAGREKLEASGETLSRWYEPLPFPRRRTWSLSSARRLRVEPGVSLVRGRGLFPGVTGGKIVFDYGADTIRAAAGLDEAEARDLLDELAARFPALAQARRME